ncbi:HAD family hydrolase [Anderseniella sp. Alg231-50]|uniref:HAD family hydrolase n=1 Tax=Anderseniella sp. Alg231-50 TaxID=1922226 RepID=UPI00307C8EB6
MTFTTIIFDFDGVLSAYDRPARLDALSGIAGLDRATILDRIWGSGFEDAADSGECADDAAYLSAFNDHLGYRLSRDEWIASRAAAMQHWPDMHDLATRLSKHYKLAMLTNNGPLTKAAFAELAPETADLFGDRAFFSCDFGTKKPDGKVFEQVATRLGSACEDCIFIDDKQRHCDGAARTGMTGILFNGIGDLENRLTHLGILKVSG